MAQWSLDDIAWDRFDADAVDPDIVTVVKAAAMVEYNSADYATYLCNVFASDDDFCAAARRWADEEVQHGAALRRWAERADPGFDFEAAFRRFTDGYSLPLDSTQSVRGSRTGELIARCVVEVGTSSHYSALRDGVDEPVLKEICHRIAGDEFRHYKLFLTHLRRYQAREPLSRPRRLAIALGRLAEGEDDELGFAYHCGSESTAPYRRKACVRAYERKALPLYRPGHVDRALAMVAKAVGFDPRGRVSRWLGRAAWVFLRTRVRRLAAA